MKKIIAFILLLTWVVSLFAQDSIHPYKVNYPIIGSVIAVGAGTSGYTFYRICSKPGISMEQLSQLQASSIKGFDRNATRHYSPGALTANRVLTTTSAVLPAFLFIDKNIRKDAGTVSLMYMEAMSMSHLVYGLTAAFVDRKRPYVYNTEAPTEVRTGTRGQSSMYAYLPMLTATASVFSAKVWSDYHPHSKLKPLVWTAAGTAIVGSNLLSYYAGDAHPTDLILGTALGAATGYLVPFFKQKLAEKKRKQGKLNEGY